MEELRLANEVLNEIISNGQTTKKAINKIFSASQKARKHASIVSILVGCELRHHIMFSSNFTEELASLSEEEKNLIYLVMANNFFLKRLSKEECEKYIIDVLKDKYDEKLSSMLNFEGNLSELVKFDKTSLKYTSVRFNTPEWLVKMWKKHYGNKNTYLTLKANITQPKTFVMKNTIKEVELTSDFEKSEFENIYTYLPKTSIKKNPLYKAESGLGGVYRVNPVLIGLIDKYLDPLSKEWTLYSGEDDDIVKHFYVKSNREVGINLAVPSLDDRPNLLRLIRLERVKNINMFKGDSPVALSLGISYKQDFVLVYPRSSSFNRIRLYPDYVLHFKKEELDEIIKTQKESLKNLSDFVEDNGVLIYFVDTLNKKETKQIVDEFLKENPDFTLVEEKQCFPFENSDVISYYAVFKLEVADD